MVLGFLGAIISFIVVFMAIVVVHELGHFVFAKIFDVEVLEFSIGFGPALWKRRGRDTVFSIRAIPFGGYVRLAGENPEDSEGQEGRRFYDKKAWQRLLIAFGGPLFSILAGYVLFIVIVSVWGVGLSGIGTVLPGTPAERAGLKNGDMILKVNGKYVFDPSVISEIIKRGEKLEVTVLRDGKKVRVVAKPQMIPEQVDVVLGSAEGTPAGLFKDLEGFENISAELLRKFRGVRVRFNFEEGYVEGVLQDFSYVPKRYALGFVYAGYSNVLRRDAPPFRKGDRILKVDDIPIGDWLWMIRAVSYLSLSKKDATLELYGRQIDWFSYGSGENVTVLFERDGARRKAVVSKEFLLKLFRDPSVFELSMKPYKPKGILERIDIAVSRCNWILILSWRMVFGKGLFRSIASGEVAGPVGIAQIVGTASKLGMDSILVVVAVITMSLGIFNLLPLPALDGGRIVFALVEMISRKKVDPKLEALIHTIGFFFLMLLLIFLTFVDIGRMVGR